MMPHVLRREDASIDLVHREIEIHGRRVHRLAGRRFEVFLVLFRNEKPMGQDELLNEIWGIRDYSKVVQMTVSRLREDLKNVPEIQIRTDARSYELVIRPDSRRR